MKFSCIQENKCVNDVSFSTFYSKFSPYPGLFCYWNSADNTSPVHPILSALSNNQVIRGPVIFARNCDSPVQDTSPWSMDLEVQEIIDTFKLHQNEFFHFVNGSRTRDDRELFTFQNYSPDIFICINCIIMIQHFHVARLQRKMFFNKL